MQLQSCLNSAIRESVPSGIAVIGAVMQLCGPPTHIGPKIRYVRLRHEVTA